MGTITLTAVTSTKGKNPPKDSNLKKYTSTQGYAIKSNGKHIVAIRNDNTNETALIKLNGNVREEMKLGKKLGHANDCTCHDGHVFVAQGGGDTKSCDIKEFDETLQHVATYQYVEKNSKTKLENITSIAHVKQNYFIIGEGRNYVVARLNKSAKTLDGCSAFELKKSDVDGLRKSDSISKRSPQGICYADGKLYKAYSYTVNSKITRNDIACFDLPSSSPSFSGTATLLRKYTCDKTDKSLFEIESIDSPDGGNTFYIASNESSGDMIYKATLRN